MSAPSSAKTDLATTVMNWWRERRLHYGFLATANELISKAREFLVESLPERRQRRYGDAEFDWDYRVDTTSGTSTWRERLVGLFHSPYQPTEPTLFREMIETWKNAEKMDLADFTFVDIGSGKGRALLLASEYPFRRIIGVELFPELHRIAEQNIEKYKSATQRCFEVNSVCADAREFVLPEGRLLLYLFNPLPEHGLRQMLGGIERSWRSSQRPLYILYHNPVYADVLADCGWLAKVAGTHQYSLFAAARYPA